MALLPLVPEVAATAVGGCWCPPAHGVSFYAPGPKRQDLQLILGQRASCRQTYAHELRTRLPSMHEFPERASPVRQRLVQKHLNRSVYLAVGGAVATGVRGCSLSLLFRADSPAQVRLLQK